MASDTPEQLATVAAAEFEQIAQRVAQSTQAVFQGKPNVERVAALVAEIDSVVDKNIDRFQQNSKDKVDCKPGCCWCCHEVVLATAPEIIAIYQYVLTHFSEDELDALRKRLAEYDTAVAPFRKGAFTFVRQTCPFLVDSLCTVHSARPLACRGKSSTDADLCRIWKEDPGFAGTVPNLVPQQVAYLAAEKGISFGAGTKGDIHELGLAMKLLFDDPSLAERVIAGSYKLPMPVAKVPAKRFPPDHQSVSPPSMFSHSKPVAEAANHLYYSRKKEAAAISVGSSTAELFLKLRPPAIYSSFEQILEFRGEMGAALDELQSSKIDFGEGLALISDHSQASLPYQGLTLKSLLEKQGRLFYDRVISMAYPRLCEPITGPRKPGKFRLGYISGSLTNGHNCKWALGWLRNHSAEIETHAFNLGIEDIGSKMWAEAADRYYRLEGNLQRIAEFIRSKELDALIITDIGSFPRDFIYFSLRLARIQCTAWGIPTTSGLPNIDYYLSSELMEPVGAEAEYTEKLVRLPRSGLCYPRPKTSFWTSEFTGKSKEFFPFMAQNIRKWTPQRDPLLKRLADRYGKPLKFLSLPDPELTRQYSQRMSKSGIEHEMLPLAYPKAYANYLRSAHVSFDPPDWSGGNTTIEALSYGVPVVTLSGPFMRGRHSAAFLKIVNAEGLIAKDEDDFVDLVFDQDRQTEAMRSLNVDALYEDKGVVKALDAFLLSTSKL